MQHLHNSSNCYCCACKLQLLLAQGGSRVSAACSWFCMRMLLLITSHCKLLASTVHGRVCLCMCCMNDQISSTIYPCNVTWVLGDSHILLTQPPACLSTCLLTCLPLQHTSTLSSSRLPSQTAATQKAATSSPALALTSLVMEQSSGMP